MGTSEDVSSAVEQIVNGTLEGRKVAAAQSEWEKQFTAMTNEFRKLMKSHEETDDTASMRSSLRRYIEQLEALYEGL